MTSQCLFCRIVSGEVPCDKVYEDELILAFKDIHPEAPTHILVIPKQHAANILELSQNDDKLIISIFKTMSHLAHENGIDLNGFRIVTNTGPDGGQTVDHVHFHLLGGRNMTWPPG
ncbi:MAG: histidine triad nucleotide-binding protein [Candidatus Margulisbacteria bacterium]|nr:histidine triad nucleotide-binding protein [Candidatus Margulisiibacteriota bacterium]